MNSGRWTVAYLKHYQTGPARFTVGEGILTVGSKGQAEEAYHLLNDGQVRESSTGSKGKYRVVPGTVTIRQLL